jgi:hypothetical protein
MRTLSVSPETFLSLTIPQTDSIHSRSWPPNRFDMELVCYARVRSNASVVIWDKRSAYVDWLT